MIINRIKDYLIIPKYLLTRTPRILYFIYTKNLFSSILKAGLASILDIYKVFIEVISQVGLI